MICCVLTKKRRNVFWGELIQTLYTIIDLWNNNLSEQYNHFYSSKRGAEDELLFLTVFVHYLGS